MTTTTINTKTTNEVRLPRARAKENDQKHVESSRLEENLIANVWRRCCHFDGKWGKNPIKSGERESLKTDLKV